jgi:toxin ParE1/3/4
LSGYRLRPRAVEDLETIGYFIAADNPAKAVAFVDELTTVCSRIAEHPRAFQRRDDLAEGLRQAVHRRYLILFTADDSGVVIERVVHGARRLEDLF